MSSKPLRIGILIVPPIQLLDIAPVDLFAMLSKEYLQICNLPAPLVSLGIPMDHLEFIYIAESGPNTIAQTTPNLGLQINVGLDDPKVAPGTLDILLIPGPDPNIVPPEVVLQFVREHVRKGVELLTICTGIFVAGYAGVLDGKRATGAREIIPLLKQKFPKVEWEIKRWTFDGKIWTAAGITNGQDMVAAYLRNRWPGRLSETVIAMADVGGRGQEYPTGDARNSAWWVFNIFRTWVGGLIKRKNA
ncbi:class I glutamine amidotransferase-like protein [Zopfia rhizophila CBS 207.26]|uniref:Class I glutamine amidotransferase-like protein n=1 Tax=Zopfia rhizophila CBS 207.26 TaxID=1314779 RepID=A0A6A6D886_9PEZI|nr:class I glutamine amidotransferase-like protein [Zopfia rhizophila CBS 207.26]